MEFINQIYFYILSLFKEREDYLCFTKLDEEAITPFRAHENDVGFDLFSLDEKTIQPGGRECIRTGISIKLPQGCYGRIAPRSGLSVSFGIDIGAGVIDPGYTGEIIICVFNFGENPFKVAKYCKIAQLICEKASFPILVNTPIIDKQSRGSYGFGSSDSEGFY
jgi:dUTP pyrophosphatase